MKNTPEGRGYPWENSLVGGTFSGRIHSLKQRTCFDDPVLLLVTIEEEVDVFCGSVDVPRKNVGAGREVGYALGVVGRKGV